MKLEIIPYLVLPHVEGAGRPVSLHGSSHVLLQVVAVAVPARHFRGAIDKDLKLKFSH